MSDVNVAEAGPTDGGQAAEVTGAPAAEPTYFDPTQYADQIVKVKVDGEELEVPLAEAIQGYQRQADYTRKTQALAQDREYIEFAKALEAELANNPKRVLTVLEQQFLADFHGQDPEQEPEFTDPVEQRLAAIEQEYANQKLERDLADLSSRYGEDFNATETVAAALELQVPLELAFEIVQGRKLWALEQARRDAEAKKAAEEAAITASKRQDGFVAGGSSAQGAMEPPPRISSVADAFRAAKAELGA